MACGYLTVDRIEVGRALSALYGGDAMGVFVQVFDAQASIWTVQLAINAVLDNSYGQCENAFQNPYETDAQR